MTEIFNLLDGELPLVPDRHARDGHRYANRSLGGELGATLASVGVTELPPGQGAGAYHYELTREEWLIVVAGELTLRTPDGERVLRAGDIVCFLPGPDGAHALRNDSDVPARYAMCSTKEESRSIVYPDSNRVAVIGPDFKRMMKIGDDLEYWEGEP
jgi:uncharacterized cupin superfamily protein